MLKTIKKFRAKKENLCARTGCNNQIKRGNGTELNYCSESCQMSHYSPGSSEFNDEISEEAPPYTSSSSSNQWGVWAPNNGDAPPSYSSINNDNNIFGSFDNVQVTPLWEDDDPPSNISNSRYSSSKPVDDFPHWLGSTRDPLWTSNRNTTRNYSPPLTPRSNSPSDEEEINCPKCTFFIRPNKTVCEMCGTNVTKPEPKRSHKSPTKPKNTITSYRDLYDDEEEEENDPFADPQPTRKNNSSSSSDNYRDSSSSRSQNRSHSSHNYRDSPTKSRNQSSYLDDYEDLPHSQSRRDSPTKSRNPSYLDDYEDLPYSQRRNKSSSRNRMSNDYNSSSYQTSTPPKDAPWIEEEDTFFESVPTRRPPRQKPPPKPYATPSFFREPERRPQKPPTPPLKEDQTTCPACNFDNHSSMTHCEICYTQLNKKSPEKNERTTTFNRIEETRAKKACKTCSFYNDADSVQCEMCYLPIAETRRSPFNFLPSFFSHDVNMTQCPTCTFMNHPSMAQCEMCHGILPGNNLIQQQQQYQQIVDNSPGPTTKLISLQLNDHDYMTVQQQFKVGVPNANILAIFRVVMPQRIIQAHEAYKKQISGNAATNVTHRMYHGTHVACDAKRYYGPPGWKFCNAADCGLCGITQNGNACAKSRHGGRMWFANSSQTSLGYCRTDPVKAMFIQDIVSATGGAIIIVDREVATLVKFLIIFQ